MKNDANKKEIRAQYKERNIVGGVYLIRNTLNNKILIDAAADMQSIRNRFEFSRITGSCVNPKLQKDWSEHGSGAFVLEELEELSKGSTQTDAEFKADLQLLKEMWLEKLPASADIY